MRLVVTGASGQLGCELSRILLPLGDVTALDRQQCDLSRPELLPDLMRGLRPDVVVNAAAYTAVDKAEQEEDLAMTVNGAAVGVLAHEARKAGILLVHYSTDYVFDGARQTPYTEEDAPHPLGAYGRSKLAGDAAVCGAGGAYAILRTSWVYAGRGHNFLRTILRLAGERDELRIVDDQIGAPTWARDIADATARIIRAARDEQAQGQFVSGIFNLTAAGATSWHGFAEAILHEAEGHGLLKRPPRLKAIASADYPTPAERPKNSRLSGERLSQRFHIALSDWRLGLARCIADMKTNAPSGD